MPTLTETLHRIAPGRVAPLDHADLARRARRRRNHRRAISTGLGAIAMAATVVLATGGLPTSEGNDSTLLTTSLVAPDGTVLGESFGTWRQGAAMPFDPEATRFHGVLPDGRVLVWGTPPVSDRQPAVAGDGALELRSPGGAQGGIYDPGADRWTLLPPPPLGVRDTRAVLAGEELLVVGPGPDGRIAGLVLDARTGTWTTLPGQDELAVFVDAVAWDGETAALVRLEPGGTGWSGDPGLDWRVDRPVTLRWHEGDEAWTRGAPPPLSARFGAGVLAEDGSITVTGGTERDRWATAVDPGDEPAPDVPDPRARADGATYDVGADAWSSLPDLPEPGIYPTVGRTSEGHLMAGAALASLTASAPTPPLSPTWVLDGSAWVVVPDPPAPEGAPDQRPAVRGDGFVGTYALSGHSGPQPGWFRFGGAWEQAPLQDLHRWGDLVLATSATGDNPDDGAFTVRLRVGPDAWLTAAAAPFANRMDAAVAVVGDRLVVIGGSEGTDLEPAPSVWVLDLVPAGGGEG